MPDIKIPKSEFQTRAEEIKDAMKRDNIDVVFVYGDEYRKENLRYVSNYWPIFERGGFVMGVDTAPIVLCAPEGEKVAHEMSAWPDIRLIPDFLCVTVPDVIEYPLATYTSFKKLALELTKGKPCRLAIAGSDAMSASLLNSIKQSFNAEIVDYNHVLFQLRLIKTNNEIACLREAARIAETGFKAMMDENIIGKTERYAAGIAEGVARKEGAEAIIFNVFGSGERTNTIVGRPENKIIKDGDMIMCALAIQYEGYVSTCEIPYAVGNYSEKTKRVVTTLINASAAGLPFLKAGLPMKQFVTAVRDYFRKEDLSQYDVYPPLHGIGCAEAESPYPNEGTDAVFEEGMTVNTDISLFGLEGGSNRVEESFVVTKDGAETLSPFSRSYYKKWLQEEK